MRISKELLYWTLLNEQARTLHRNVNPRRLFISNCLFSSIQTERTKRQPLLLTYCTEDLITMEHAHVSNSLFGANIFLFVLLLWRKVPLRSSDCSKCKVKVFHVLSSHVYTTNLIQGCRQNYFRSNRHFMRYRRNSIGEKSSATLFVYIQSKRVSVGKMQFKICSS